MARQQQGQSVQQAQTGVRELSIASEGVQIINASALSFEACVARGYPVNSDRSVHADSAVMYLKQEE
jgi:hypothetical protein